MSSVLIVMLALTAPPDGGEAAASSVPAVASPQVLASAAKSEEAEGTAKMPELPPRTGPKLRKAVRAALRRWARPSDAQAQTAAREFLVLYKELEADDQLARSQRRYFRGKVRMRLAGLSDQIALRIARQKRLAESGARKTGASTDTPSTAENAESPGATSPDPAAEVASGGQGFGPGAYQMPDHGQALIDLIQTVIQPETWDVNGGPGTIYYWYPGRALVIRQTAEVHERIGGALDQLRRAGR